MTTWKIDDDGWCDGAVRYDSPYHDARPEGARRFAGDP
jgi:AmpD protein